LAAGPQQEKETDVKDGVGRGLEAVRKKPKGTVKQTIASMSKTERVSTPGTAMEVWEVWRDTYTEVYQPERMYDWTKSKLGQASNLLKRIPSEDLLPALEYAIRNWQDLRVYLKDNTAAFDLPLVASWDICVKWADEVILFYQTPRSTGTIKSKKLSVTEAAEQAKRKIAGGHK
jgi:hypothetical protein